MMSLSGHNLIANQGRPVHTFHICLLAFASILQTAKGTILETV